MSASAHTRSVLLLAAALFGICAELSTTAVAAPVAVGDKAPPFSGVTLDGREVTLDSLRGNVIILNFWATWCGPCKKELPLLDAYAHARESYGFRVVAVTTDGDRVPTRAIKGLQDVLHFPLLKRYHGRYSPIGNAIPTNYIIDRDGVIRYARAAAFDLDTLNTLLVPLLNDPPPQPPSTGPAQPPKP